MSETLLVKVDRFNRAVLQQSIPRDMFMKIFGGWFKILFALTKNAKYTKLGKSINDGRSVLRLGLLLALPGRVQAHWSKRGEPIEKTLLGKEGERMITNVTDYVQCFGYVLEALASVFDNLSLITRWYPGGKQQQKFSMKTGHRAHVSMGTAYLISTFCDVLVLIRMYARQKVDPIYTEHDFTMKKVTFLRHLCDALATGQSSGILPLGLPQIVLGLLNIVAGLGSCYEFYQYTLAADMKKKADKK